MVCRIKCGCHLRPEIGGALRGVFDTVHELSYAVAPNNGRPDQVVHLGPVIEQTAILDH